MGKASKWIRNFLLGKKEEKFKKIDTSYPENNKTANMGNQMVLVSSKVKRRWSFGKLKGGSGRITGKEVAADQFSISYDSGDSTKMHIQALLETRAPQHLRTAFMAKVSENTEYEKRSATKIQAAFRSYLARKALHALKGLVKLQALVRGHLVRKQTTATLRGMHALMSIQVRARIQRIQMVEEAKFPEKQLPQHREIPSFKGLMTEQNKDSKNTGVEEMLGVRKSRSGPLEYGSHVKSRKYDSMGFYSKQLSVSKREHQFEENTITTEPNSPANYRDMLEINPTTMALSTSQCHLAVPHRQSWSANYMNKTESSRAKSRSRSEPRQRPKQGMKHKNKCVESPLNGPSQNLFSNSSRFDQGIGSLDHWVINLRGSVKDNSKRDSFGSSTVTSDSYYYY